MPTTGRSIPGLSRQQSPARIDDPLMIVGASARPHVQSAAKVGIRCIAVDLFADWDTRKVCPCYAVANYADTISLLPIIKAGVVGGDLRWMICGGMENRPDLILALQKHVPYIGTSPASLNRLCDPFDLADFLARHRVSFPVTRRQLRGQAGQTNWLCKPTRSSGGHRIQLAIGDHCPERNFCFQEFINGQSCAAVFGAGCDHLGKSHVQLIGVTQQLVGLDALVDRPMAYCGSIGPIRMQPSTEAEIIRIGKLVASEYAIGGIFGIDLVIRDSTVFVIEVNPRVTASCEVLEMAGLCESITSAHVQCAIGQTLPDRCAVTSLDYRAKQFGKAIVFSLSDSPIEISRAMHGELVRQHVKGSVRIFADIPCPGTVISPGGPIVTVFAQEDDPAAVLETLTSRAMDVRRITNSTFP